MKSWGRGASLLLAALAVAGGLPGARGASAEEGAHAPIRGAALHRTCEALLDVEALATEDRGELEAIADPEERKARLSTHDAARRVLSDPNIVAIDAFCKATVQEVLLGSIPSPKMVRDAEAAAGEVVPRERAFFGLAGGVTQSSLLWGLTDVLLKRAGQELNIWAFHQVRDQLCGGGRTGPKFHLGNLVPDTCQVILPEDYFLGSPGSLLTLQQAARRDLVNLPTNSAGEVVRCFYCRAPEAGSARSTPSGAACDSPRWNDAIHTLDVLARAGQTALDTDSVARALVKIPYRDCHKELPCLAGIERTEFPVVSGVYDAAFLLGAVYDESTDGFHRPESPEELEAAVKAAIVNANAKRTGWPKTSPLFPIADKATRVWDQVERAKTAVENLEQAQDAEDTVRLQATAVAESLGVLRVVLEVVQPAEPSPEFLRGLRASRSMESFARTIAARNLALAGLEVAWVVVEYLPSGSPAAIECRRVLALGGALAEAKDTEGVARALDSFVAPAGTSQGKRSLRHAYVQVNAYAGIFLAAERAAGETRPSVAPWLSVGLEGGVGNRKIGPFGAAGLYIQALDLGALGAYRLRSKKTETEPEVSFKDVFSPGVFLTLALKKAPISIAVGASYSPELRKITGSSPERVTSALRYGITAALDVPIFP